MGQPVGAVFEYSLVGQVNGQRTISSLHYVVSIPSAIGDPQLEALAIMAELESFGSVHLTDEFLAACSSDWTLLYTRGQFVGPIRFAYAQKPKNVSGIIASDCRAQNVSGVITKRTGLSGRNQIGALHMPGVPVSGYTAGEITPALQAKYALVAADLILPVTAAIGAGKYLPCLWHKTHAFPAWTDQVLYTVVQPELRVMRRRTVGLGI
jgi:hypothetical protein